MKRHLNTLFVTTQGAYLSKEGESVVVRADGAVLMRVPFHNLDGVVCFGRVTASGALMGRCAERGVAVSFLTERGRFLARVVGFTSGNVLLRRAQYRSADDAEASLEIARACVLAKLANSRSVVLRAVRDHRPGDEVMLATGQRIQRCIKVARRAEGMDRLRGAEGEAARAYFGVFDRMITNDSTDFRFKSRSRRPPRNIVNALLSFLYSMLAHDVRSACEVAGLDPAVGFFHRDRSGRPGLALDLMEEFRAVIADRVVLNLINRKQVKAAGFEMDPGGGVRMSDDTRKTVLVAYQERKIEELVHPFLKEKTTVGMLPQLQALLLARFLRGDMDAYPPFLAR